LIRREFVAPNSVSQKTAAQASHLSRVCFVDARSPRAVVWRHGAEISGQAPSHLTPALQGTLLEDAQTRNQDFALACEQTVEDGNCLWKEKEKDEETAGHGFRG
jgi:hypothetical protein